MIKPTKSLKNSFIFLETIFAILLLSSAVAIFINLPLHQLSSEPSIQIIENQFLLKQYDNKFNTSINKIAFTKNDTQTLELTVQTITYETSTIKLQSYEF